MLSSTLVNFTLVHRHKRNLIYLFLLYSLGRVRLLFLLYHPWVFQAESWRPHLEYSSTKKCYSGLFLLTSDIFDDDNAFVKDNHPPRVPFALTGLPRIFVDGKNLHRRVPRDQKKTCLHSLLVILEEPIKKRDTRAVTDRKKSFCFRKIETWCTSKRELRKEVPYCSFKNKLSLLPSFSTRTEEAECLVKSKTITCRQIVGTPSLCCLSLVIIPMFRFHLFLVAQP